MRSSLAGWVAWFALGVVSGVLAGIMGIGGAIIMVPAMALGGGIEQHHAQGISLAVITITSLVGAFTHYKLGNVSVSSAVLMAPSAIIVVILASLIAGQLPSLWLSRIFGLVLLWFAYQFTFRSVRRAISAASASLQPAGPAASAP